MQRGSDTLGSQEGQPMTDSETASISRRGAWRLLLVALALPSFVTVVYFVLLADAAAAVQQAAYVVGKAIQFALPVVWIVLIRKHRPRWKAPTAGDLAQGAGFGCLVLVVMLTLYHLWLKPSGFFESSGAAITAKVAGIGLGGRGQFVALGVFYALRHSFLEEYYWRWFAFGELRRVTALAPAILLSSLGFMAHHVVILAIYFGWFAPATWLFSASVAVGGAAWAWLYERHGTLWGCWASHLLVDAGIFAIGYDLIYR